MTVTSQKCFVKIAYLHARSVHYTANRFHSYFRPQDAISSQLRQVSVQRSILPLIRRYRWHHVHFFILVLSLGSHHQLGLLLFPLVSMLTGVFGPQRCCGQFQFTDVVTETGIGVKQLAAVSAKVAVRVVVPRLATWRPVINTEWDSQVIRQCSSSNNKTRMPRRRALKSKSSILDGHFWSSQQHADGTKWLVRRLPIRVL